MIHRKYDRCEAGRGEGKESEGRETSSSVSSRLVELDRSEQVEEALTDAGRHQVVSRVIYVINIIIKLVKNEFRLSSRGRGLHMNGGKPWAMPPREPPSLAFVLRRS